MERNWSFIRQTLVLGAAAMFFGLGTISNARADVIAVSLDNVTNYSFSQPSGGLSVLISPNQSISSASANFNAAASSNSATCPGVGPCNPGGLSANAPQATAGPGPFPGPDNYTQPPGGGFVGSRGDANVTSISFDVPPTGAGGANIAESRLNSPTTTGGATGTNQIVTNVEILGVVGQQSTAFNFSFVADPYLEVTVGQAGDIAAAILGASISLVNAAGQTQFLWIPGASSGEINVASKTDPFSLNQSLTATMPAENQIFNPAAGTFNATSGALSPGVYTLTLQMNETVRTLQGGPAVPEPSAFLLLVSGLVVLALVRRRLAA